ncbi:uncharacterized protein PHALS_01018 [Plasmopara halstedii]|uniref:Uncharacterized protein n=1 Tax=Plasmopara halstedii TaxID=4781 RepID=A0A0P1AUG4_PLAHL|nr:uncharacterized protein PHALS_01018 [Plasmopara halstedii]CEG44671.1 hypothetical protein PHALS_01018 [Plasmopara halstedii]|eukprot:XP_024581040.1 hypothetical protein PHALS_01018 [Plasmopara halstedii]
MTVLQEDNLDLVVVWNAESLGFLVAAQVDESVDFHKSLVLSFASKDVSEGAELLVGFLNQLLRLVFHLRSDDRVRVFKAYNVVLHDGKPFEHELE